MQKLNENKGKVFALATYVLVALILPFFSFLPVFQSKAQKDSGMYLQKLVSREVDSYLRQYMGALHRGNTDEIYSYMRKEARDEISTTSLASVAAHFASTTEQMDIVGATVHTYREGAMVTDYVIEYEIENKDNTNPFVLAEVKIEAGDNKMEVYAIHMTPEPESVKKSGSFDINKLGVFLLLAVMMQLFIVYTAYRYISVAQNPRWWLLLVILFGSVFFTADGGVYKINIGFSSLFAKGGLAWMPWHVAIPFPLGSLYYYFREKFVRKHR